MMSEDHPAIRALREIAFGGCRYYKNGIPCWQRYHEKHKRFQWCDPCRAGHALAYIEETQPQYDSLEMRAYYCGEHKTFVLAVYSPEYGIRTADQLILGAPCCESCIDDGKLLMAGPWNKAAREYLVDALKSAPTKP